jgi:transcriptional regulator with XRE-family HTH domain
VIAGLWHNARMVKTAKSLFRSTFIRQWRTHRGLSLVQLAERVAEISGKSMTHATLSRIETGKIAYTQPVLEAIAIALACEPADLLMRNPEDKSAPWSILDSLKKADQATVNRVVAVVSALTKTGT